ncbi:MAG TPA: PAS domain S-box protein, partial [Anaeromyxobacteraceae bacterium]|nr:PAS domain S-box protein [Anaeromyxobacteraceae bacterium]
MKRKAPGKARGRRPRARSGPSAARDERLRTAVAASHDGFWDRDLVSGRVFHSARMNQMIGLPPVDGEAADEAWRERIHPDDLAVVGARYLAVLEGRDDRVDDTYRVRREDGAWIWVHARGQVAERDTSGRATRIAGTVTDVSALKVAEHALQASEEKYRALVESSVNGIAILRDGRVEYANAASAPILGVPDASHLVGRAVLDFIVPEQRDRARARMAEGLTGGVLPRLDFTVLRGDGTTTEVISSPSPFRDAKGPAIHAMIQDVTAERRVSRSLEKRTRELEAILASSTDWITFLDADGNVLSVNDAASEITGYTRGELERMNVREIAREDALEVQARIRECLEAGTSRFEARFRRKDGQVRDAELSVQAIEGEAGRLVAFVRDVTARKQAEKALRANEARLRMALQGSRDGLVDLDVGTGAFVGNPRMWEIVGWPEGRWKDVFDASLESVHADDLARVQGALGKVLASEASGFDEEFRVRRQDGETVWVRARFGVVERDASGRAARAAGTLSDITELKLAHETTRAQAAMLRAIADSSDDLIFAKDANGRWTFANRALLRFVGKAEGDVLGRTDAEMLGDDERVRRIAVNDAHVTRTGESLLLEEEVARPDGLHVFLSSKSPLRDAAGRTVGVVGVAKDITDRKRVEDALRASEKALREASATVQRHLANTPLAVIEWDGDYRVTSFRGRAEEIFGWSAAEV